MFINIDRDLRVIQTGKDNAVLSTEYGISTPPRPATDGVIYDSYFNSSYFGVIGFNGTTQRGIGCHFKAPDENKPDWTPFVIKASGFSSHENIRFNLFAGVSPDVPVSSAAGNIMEKPHLIGSIQHAGTMEQVVRMQPPSTMDVALDGRAVLFALQAVHIDGATPSAVTLHMDLSVQRLAKPMPGLNSFTR